MVNFLRPPFRSVLLPLIAIGSLLLAQGCSSDESASQTPGDASVDSSEASVPPDAGQDRDASPSQDAAPCGNPTLSPRPDWYPGNGPYRCPDEYPEGEYKLVDGIDYCCFGGLCGGPPCSQWLCMCQGGYLQCACPNCSTTQVGNLNFNCTCTTEHRVSDCEPEEDGGGADAAMDAASE